MTTARDVQFRFLQVVVNHVADERVTVGLLHWDGCDLRVVINPQRVPEFLPAKLDLRSSLRSMHTSLTARAAAPALDVSLDSLCPVPVGETGLLSWGQLRRGQTKAPQSHFDQLATTLGLGRTAASTRSQLVPRFAVFAEGLAATVNRPDVVRAHVPLSGLTDYDSPLSWKNGVWRHTFPLDIAIQPSTLARRMEKLFGRIDATVPRGEVGVVIAVHEPALDDALARAEEHIKKNLGGRVEALRAPLKSGTPDFSELEDKVRKDIASAS